MTVKDLLIRNMSWTKDSVIKIYNNELIKIKEDTLENILRDYKLADSYIENFICNQIYLQ